MEGITVKIKVTLRGRGGSYMPYVNYCKRRKATEEYVRKSVKLDDQHISQLRGEGDKECYKDKVCCVVSFLLAWQLA